MADNVLNIKFVPCEQNIETAQIKTIRVDRVSMC